MLAEKTGMGRRWIRLVLLATVTSLPELATSVSAVTVAAVPNISVGDVLGSCVFKIGSRVQVYDRQYTGCAHAHRGCLHERRHTRLGVANRTSVQRAQRLAAPIAVRTRPVTWNITCKPSIVMSTRLPYPSEEKPQNGLAGLKHWRYDLLAGLQVSLVSLPLSLGIAIASGAPPVTGLVSAIIAGLIFPFIGGAYVTISGPAAGLVPVLLAGMLTLGNGDLAVGYPLLLVAICLTGAVQIVLCLFRAGEFARMLPIAVVEGMLASIGLMIIVKQLPIILGDLSGPSKTIAASLAKLPQQIAGLDPLVLGVGLVSLLLMFSLSHYRPRQLRIVPPPLFVALVGIALGGLLGLDGTYLIAMPENLLQDGFTLPAFGEVLERRDLWWSMMTIVVTLTLIDGIESLATIAAVDKIDPFQRRSQPNRTLLAMGVSNMLSSLAGGLTIIPGGIKSRANIDAGGRTLWANAYNAMFLLIFLWIGTAVIEQIPLATLAAILIYVSWRLCEPIVWKRALAVGREQLVVFAVTVATTLWFTDLLVGIMVGVLAKALLLVYLVTPSARFVLSGRLSPSQWLRLAWANLREFFTNPVMHVKHVDNGGAPSIHVYLATSVCFNLLKLERAIAALPPAPTLTFVFTRASRIVDHTTMEHLHYLQEQRLRDGRTCQIRGLDGFHRFSTHPLSVGLHDPEVRRAALMLSTRQQQMKEFAHQRHLGFSPAIVSILNEHGFIFLRRGSNREECNTVSGPYKRSVVRLFDYSFTLLPIDHTEHRHTVIMIGLQDPSVRLPDCVLEPDHYLQTYLVEYHEISLAAYPQFREHYHLRGQDDAAIQALFVPELIRFLETHPDFYVEIRDNAILAFRVDKELEPGTDLDVLLAFADLVDGVYLAANAGTPTQ